MPRQGLRDRELEQSAERAEILKLLDICEGVLLAYTMREMEDQRSSVRTGRSIPFGIGNLIAKLSKGVSLKEADELIRSVSSIAGGQKRREDIEGVVGGFPDGVVKDYAKDLANPVKTLRTIKEEYCRESEEVRREYYEQLRKLRAPPSHYAISQYLALDIDLKLEEGQEGLRFPMLDFYRLLLTSYDDKHPPEMFGAAGVTELFMRALQEFASSSYESAKDSETFEAFDARMREMESVGDLVFGKAELP